MRPVCCLASSNVGLTGDVDGASFRCAAQRAPLGGLLTLSRASCAGGTSRVCYKNLVDITETRAQVAISASAGPRHAKAGYNNNNNDDDDDDDNNDSNSNCNSNSSSSNNNNSSDDNTYW